MRITRQKAMRIWERHYGGSEYAEDFHGYFMCKSGYGNPEFYIWENGKKLYCGWNIHHILPIALGGTNDISNLICTNIATNEGAADRTTYWIDDNLYQVRRGCSGHEIVKLR